MASACEESSRWNLEWLQPAHFPQNILELFYMLFSLFTPPPRCLSSLPLPPPCNPPPLPSFSSALPQALPSQPLSFGWGSSCDFSFKASVGSRWDIFIVPGWEDEEGQRSRDWREGMMYVAAVSPLSSSPLSLIMAISFFQSCLVCTAPQKSHCFSMP